MELNDQEYVQGIEILLENGGVINKETLVSDIRKQKEKYPKDYYSDTNTMLTYILCQHQASDVIKNLIKVINK